MQCTERRTSLLGSIVMHIVSNVVEDSLVGRVVPLF